MSNAQKPEQTIQVPVLDRLRTRLLLLVLLPLIPALGLIIHSNLKEREIEQKRVEEAATAIAKLAAANQGKYIKNAHQLLETVGNIGFLVNSTHRQFSQTHLIHLRILTPDYLDFGLIESNGVLFCSAENTNGTPDLSKRWDFQLVLKTKRFVVGDFQRGGHTHKPALHFGYPILNTNGEVHRVFYASLNLGLLSEAAAQISLPSQAAITVFDRSGSILARYPDSENWVGKSLAQTPFVQNLLQIKEGVFQMEGYDGVPNLFAVAPVSDGKEPALFVTVGSPVAISFANANRLLLRSAVILVAVAFLALWITRAYSRRFVLEPVTALVSASQKLAQGDLKARAGLKGGKGEISQLASAFDRMAAAIQKRDSELEAAHQEIRRMNAELEQRVKDRTVQLEEANRELESFSYSVSHDLRAPLRHIDGYSKILEQEYASCLPEEGKQYLWSIHKASRKMDRLVEDLLAFSRTGQLALSKVQVQSTRLVQDIVEEMAPETERRKIQWKIGQLPDVFADPTLLRQVWTNLILNAIKYTAKQEFPCIMIGSLAGKEGEHVFFIQDNGVGFDMSHAGRLFGAFQRLHGNKEFEGNGIGLANVHRIIIRHGGKVWAEAKVNEGATFFFCIPKQS